MGTLDPYRVVEVAGFGTGMCGQMLADLGADVVVVEPPEGDGLRRRGPFYQDNPHPDRSLSFWAYNRNKRGVTLNLRTPDGQALFRRLAAGADFVLEGLPPGEIDALGLGYEALAAGNPRLIMVSTSPWGQDGPKAQYGAVDIIIAAASVLWLTGDADRPPLRISVPQAHAHAGAEAAATALIAHYGRERSGRGQHLDVSAQTAYLMATQSYHLAPGWEDAQTAASSRVAGGSQVAGITFRLVFSCKDGDVSCLFFFGSVLGHATQRLMQVVHEAGFADETLLAKDYVDYGRLLLTGQEPPSELARAHRAVEAFLMTKTKAELFALAQEKGLLIAPCSTIEDVVHSPQLAERGYWQEVLHPELGRTILYPGPFAKLSETPIEYRRRPPLLGEHNAEVFGALGLSGAELAALRGEGVL